MADFPNLTVLVHPLVQHKLTLLRSRESGTRLFAALVDEIAALLAYEATRDLPLETVEIETPMERMTGHRIPERKIVIVPVLRAGLGMVEGIRRVIPGVRVGHAGIYRNEESLEPVEYYFKAPAAEGGIFLLLDPMLATGGSASAAVGFLKDRGVQSIRFLTIVAAPEGVKKMLMDHPDVSILSASLDRGLNEAGYIVPGLGDAGDRMFGTIP